MNFFISVLFNMIL